MCCETLHRLAGTRVFLGLGSNLGPRERLLEEAIAALDTIPGCQVIRISAIYESSPWGKEDQPLFLNRVVELRTQQSPSDLLKQLQALEHRFGRQREERWGPRTLDIDLLLYGDRVVCEENLRVPHPHLAERRFVLEPLSELAAGVRVPLHEATVAELLARCPDPGIVRRVQDEKER